MPEAFLIGGARTPVGSMAQVITGLALLWSLFQLWYASPLPFMLGFGVLNDTVRADGPRAQVYGVPWTPSLPAASRTKLCRCKSRRKKAR